MKPIYQLILVLSFCLAGTSMTYSQSILQNEPDRDLEQRARDAAEMWTRELALRPKQTALMEDKLIEFAQKQAAVVNSKMREKAKTERLEELEIMENLHMRDILTKPQYELFIAIKHRQAREKENPPQK